MGGDLARINNVRQDITFNYRSTSNNKKLVGQEVTDGMTNRERKWIKELLNFAADEIGK